MDDLTDDIISFHAKYASQLSVGSNVIGNIALSNLKMYEQESWYLDFIAHKYNHESVLYFTQNKLYKNKVATFKLIAVDNYLRDLKSYRAEALKIIDRIEDLKKND